MDQDNPQAEKSSPEQALIQLERQLERGSLFTHTALSRNAGRIHEAESFLYGVIDLLIAQGVITQDQVLQAANQTRQEMLAKGELDDPGIALRSDGEGDGSLARVDCAERLPICRAACCALTFALSIEEVESGLVRWDLGEPYNIRREATGLCTHLDPQARGCRIYAHRPGICQRYSCARDERIWKDFDNRVLNREWLAEHTGGSRPRLVAAQMMTQTALAPDDNPHAQAEQADPAVDDVCQTSTF